HSATPPIGPGPSTPRGYLAAGQVELQADWCSCHCRQGLHWLSLQVQTVLGFRKGPAKGTPALSLDWRPSPSGRGLPGVSVGEGGRPSAPAVARGDQGQPPGSVLPATTTSPASAATGRGRQALLRGGGDVPTGRGPQQCQAGGQSA